MKKAMQYAVILAAGLSAIGAQAETVGCDYTALKLEAQRVTVATVRDLLQNNYGSEQLKKIDQKMANENTGIGVLFVGSQRGEKAERRHNNPSNADGEIKFAETLERTYAIYVGNDLKGNITLQCSCEQIVLDESDPLKARNADATLCQVKPIKAGYGPLMVNLTNTHGAQVVNGSKYYSQ